MSRRHSVLPRRVAILVVLGVCCGHATSSAAAESLAEVTEAIRIQLEHGGQPARLTVSGETVYAASALPAFYELRGYRPAWLRGSGPSAAARDLLAAIRRAGREGLTPADYHLGRIESLLGTPRKDHDRMAALDLLLTDAFLIYGAHLVNGRVNPVTFDPEWIAVRREVDLVALLTRTLDGGKVADALDSLRPLDPGYGLLVDALARYREIHSRGGWAAVPPGPSLKPGEADERVAAVRSRLHATGDLREDAKEDPLRFDEALEEALRRFQARHGLDVDGVVGPKTLEALDVPAAARVRQIELSLERWRWVPRDLGERHVLVNVPDFNLHVAEQAKTVLSMRVIVGREARRTPVFSDVMRYLVLNPSWEVPPGILRKDKLPEIRKDPGYVRRNNMHLYRLVGGAWREVDPGSLDWASTPASSLRLRQDPGPNNALGRIKFMFPNRFNVYLHDTPARELFAKARRDFSSGCIRIEKPLELAAYLLEDDPAWSGDALARALESGRERTVMLRRPLPVHLLYWTAFVDDDGVMQFRRDLYGRDAKLDAALGAPPPVPVGD